MGIFVFGFVCKTQLRGNLTFTEIIFYIIINEYMLFIIDVKILFQDNEK